jgi:hypothetical protein
MLLDPTGGFCLAVKVPKEARFVIRPGNLDAPPVAASNRLQFGHLKVPGRGNVFRSATLRRFCVPSDPTRVVGPAFQVGRLCDIYII